MKSPERAPICLITGATEGVGKATAIELVKHGFKVVLAARNAAKAEAVAQEIATITGSSAIDYIVGDLGSLEQTRRIAETFKERYPRLDVLVNNAGVFAAKRSVTADGFETMFQVNYLSHFLLTQLLVDRLSQSEQGRIINLSSSVYAIGKLDLANLQSEKKFSVLGSYAASKLFTLMFTKELAKRLAGTRITANAVHPGIVRTGMMFRAPGAFRIMAYLSLPFSIGPHKGACTSVYLATSPALREVSGHYFTRSKRVTTKNNFDTEDNRALLWNLSTSAVHRELRHDQPKDRTRPG